MQKKIADAGGSSVRALTRGLAILRFVNQNGAVSAGQIAAHIGLPRPTVYRLLQTLEEAGYILHSSSDSRVRVSRLAASLGDGYFTTSRVCQIAGPIMAELMAQLVWPLDLTTYENGAMVVQETTHGRSPLSIDRGMIGARLPILRSASGHAYLAHCGEREREVILAHLRRIADPEDALLLKDPYLVRHLREIRQRGVAQRISGSFRPKTSSLAVPILLDDAPVSVISIIWIRTALSLQQALETFEAPLREISARITARLLAD